MWFAYDACLTIDVEVSVYTTRIYEVANSCVSIPRCRSKTYGGAWPSAPLCLMRLDMVAYPEQRGRCPRRSSCSYATGDSFHSCKRAVLFAFRGSLTLVTSYVVAILLVCRRCVDLSHAVAHVARFVIVSVKPNATRQVRPALHLLAGTHLHVFLPFYSCKTTPLSSFVAMTKQPTAALIGSGSRHCKRVFESLRVLGYNVSERSIQEHGGAHRWSYQLVVPGTVIRPVWP